jgi:hypothetical protein
VIHAGPCLGSRQQPELATSTLHLMIRIAPENLSLRNRLVDAYLRRGRFVEAIERLVMQGRILHHAGRIQDALVPMRRAIEIATMAATGAAWRSCTS